MPGTFCVAISKSPPKLIDEFPCSVKFDELAVVTPLTTWPICSVPKSFTLLPLRTTKFPPVPTAIVTGTFMAIALPLVPPRFNVVELPSTNSELFPPEASMPSVFSVPLLCSVTVPALAMQPLNGSWIDSKGNGVRAGWA